MDQTTKLCGIIDRFLVSELARDYVASKNYPEFIQREKYLNENFHNIVKIVRDVNLKTHPHASLLISKVVILYEDLKSEGPWSSHLCKKYTQKMDCAFDAMYSVSVNRMLKSNVFNAQEIFDKCMKVLHQRITAENFRKHPSLVEVYFNLVLNNYKLKINPTTVLPLSLLLIDDCCPAKKTKGLNCCSAILLSLNESSFQNGNFYEVVLSSLLKAINEKDLDIIGLVLENLVQLLTILPVYAQKPALEKTFNNILDQLMTESNLYRKAACLNFTASLIEMHGINCINRKCFKTILRDSFDECCNESVAEVLLPSAIEVSEMWIQYCWCAWRLTTPSDHKILSTLFKLLYVTKEAYVTQIQNLITTLISLCRKKEQTEIMKSFSSTPDIKNEEFLKRLQIIKKNLTA